MSPTPTRRTRAGQVYNDLRNLARRQGRDPGEMFTLYALEGFLARLAASDQSSDFVLKGGMLMAAFAVRRPTRDIDLAALGVANDISEIEDRVRRIVGSDLNDGLSFDPSAVVGESIRDDAEYAGVRVKVTALLATARIGLHVDTNFGDPICPAPDRVELPLLLGGTLRLAGYPDHMVLVEKIVTAIDRGETNTRWRDFVDITAITRTRQIDYGNFYTALVTVARHRGVLLQPLGQLVEGMADRAQTKWSAWRRRQRLEDTTPARFAEVLSESLAFCDPVLRNEVSSDKWDPIARAWTQK